MSFKKLNKIISSTEIQKNRRPVLRSSKSEGGSISTMKFLLWRRRIICILLFVTFLSTNTLYSAPDSRQLFKNKKVDIQKLSTEQEQALQEKQSVIEKKRGVGKKPATEGSPERQRGENKILSKLTLSDLCNINIPQEIGKVVEVYNTSEDRGQKTEDRKLIVHIQDLHTNPEAQFNSAKILEILIKDYKLGLVCSEGADGVVDTSSVSSFPDPEVRDKVAKIFVNSGELTGEEYLSITKYPELPIYGIEDKDLYFKHILDFNNIMRYNPDSQNLISQIRDSLKELKPKIYSKKLLELDSKEIEYEDNKLDATKFLDYLVSLQPKGWVPEGYRNISIFRETQNLEKIINQEKVIKESQDLVAGLEKSLKSKSLTNDLDTLITKAQLFKEQKISPYSFYSYLKELSLKHLQDKELSKLPNFNNYVDYLTKLNSLDSLMVFQEIEDLSYKIKEDISTNPSQKLLMKAIKHIKLLANLVDLKLSNEEMNYYLNNKEEFKVGFFKDVITRLTTEGSPERSRGTSKTDYIDFNPDFIDGHLTELEEFYDTAYKREKAMFNKLVTEIENRKSKVTALITGGFHTPGLTRLLKEKGYSYIVVLPFSDTTIDEENYRNLLAGKRRSIEELIKEFDTAGKEK